LELKAEQISKNNRLLEDVNNILSGKSYYGQCEIEKNKINTNFYWIGVNGHTASIGQWMREVWHLIKNGCAVVQGYKWYTSVNMGRSDQKQWYFGFKLTHDGDEVIVACGGATDYSGEGGRGKLLAEKFMETICPEHLIKILDANHLISILTGGVFA